jgi:hypothetical protein
MIARDQISAFSRFLPSVDAGLGYSHSVNGPSSEFKIDRTTGIPIPLQPTKRVSWSSYTRFSAQQMLFDGGSIFNFARAKYMKAGAASTYDYTLQSTIYRVKSAYFDLLKRKSSCRRRRNPSGGIIQALRHDVPGRKSRQIGRAQGQGPARKRAPGFAAIAERPLHRQRSVELRARLFRGQESQGGRPPGESHCGHSLRDCA